MKENLRLNQGVSAEVPYPLFPPSCSVDLDFDVVSYTDISFSLDDIFIDFLKQKEYTDEVLCM